MKKVLLSAAIVPLLSLAAYAADLPDTKAPPFFTPPPPALSWTGFYIGLNAGYGWGRSAYYVSGGDPASQIFLTSPFFDFTVPFAASLGQAGVLGGGQIGYNWQFSNNFVAGIETDFDGADVSGHGLFVNPSGPFFPPPHFSTNASRTLDWFGTVRARLGFLVMPNLLLYGTGGLAYGEATANGSLLLTPPAGVTDFFSQNVGALTFVCTGTGPTPSTCYAGSGSRVSVGWTAGAGAEYRLTNNLSLKVEYLHVALAGQTIRMLSPAPPSTPGVFANARFDPEDVNIVRAGINYRFDFLAPPH